MSNPTLFRARSYRLYPTGARFCVRCTEGVRFSCRSCGHEAHADTNAAINILRRGTPSMPVEVASAPGEAGSTLEAVTPKNPSGCAPISSPRQFTAKADAILALPADERDAG